MHTIRSEIAAISYLCFVMCVAPARAQIRGSYTPGAAAVNSGALPDAGLTYQVLVQPYSFDKTKGADGGKLPVNGKVSVFIEQNTFVCVSKLTILGGTYAATANLEIASSSLTSVRFGALASASGFGDADFSPLTLGWERPRADLQASYGFTVPTGRFHDGASDNTGAGYWVHSLSAGQTVYITADKGTALSAYEVYEFHGAQKDTDARPGQTFDIDYSVTQMLPLTRDKQALLQVGVVGYGQYQTTETRRPSAIGVDARYKVNALGATAGVVLPERKVSLNLEFFKEFANRSTVEGRSLQIGVAVTF